MDPGAGGDAAAISRASDFPSRWSDFGSSTRCRIIFEPACLEFYKTERSIRSPFRPGPKAPLQSAAERGIPHDWTNDRKAV